MKRFLGEREESVLLFSEESIGEAWIFKKEVFQQYVDSHIVRARASEQRGN